MVDSLMGSVKRLVFVLGAIYLIDNFVAPPASFYARGVVFVVWGVFWIRALFDKLKG